MNNFNNYVNWDIQNLPKESGIYCFENKINGKTYIGQAQDIRKRVQQHLNSKDTLYFHNAIRKYGYINFNIYILEFADLEKLSELEIYYINKYKSHTNGYNLTEGGEGNRGRAITEEQKNIISEHNSKETWAYNFKYDYYLFAKSRDELAGKIIDKGYDINKQNIYDAIQNKSYSKDFTFGDTKEEAKELSTLVNLPKNIEFYLYNYKTKEYSPKISSIKEGAEYIKKSGCNITTNHLSVAINKNSTYIKDFLFANSLEELKIKADNFVSEIYLYNIGENILFRFSNKLTEVCNKLLELGYKTNITSLSKARDGKQKTASGFIVATSMNDLINKTMLMNIDLCENIYRLAEENNYLNNQELLNWQDRINEISVR